MKKKNIIASIHSTATQWEHKFSLEITLEKALIVLSGILSGTKSYGKEKITIISKPVFNKNNKRENMYLSRTIFLTCVGLLITLWSIASLINR